MAVEPREAAPDARDLVSLANDLEGEGKLLDAVDALTEANRLRRDSDVDRRLVRVRHEAAGMMRATDVGARAPGSDDNNGDAVPDSVVSAEALTPALIRSGILRHGYLHVRGLVPNPHVERLVGGIDRAIAASEDWAFGASAHETTPWFEPFKPAAEYSQAMKRQVGNRRKWVRESGGVWAADSPHMMFELFDIFDDVGLTQLVSTHLGERPAIAVDKCTLRRVGIDSNSDWHQDGAFLGVDIKVVNVWLSLSHCGRDAPGLDIVPRRLDHIAETGTEGAKFTWSVGPGVVERVAPPTPVTRPVFEPGDVMLFDEMFLHRTAVDPTMTRPRYAVETWFFAPSRYPERYVPLMV